MSLRDEVTGRVSAGLNQNRPSLQHAVRVPAVPLEEDAERACLPHACSTMTPFFSILVRRVNSRSWVVEAMVNDSIGIVRVIHGSETHILCQLGKSEWFWKHQLN